MILGRSSQNTAWLSVTWLIWEKSDTTAMPDGLFFFFIFKFSIAGKGDVGSSGFEVTTRAIWFKSRFSNGRTEVRAGGVRWRG